jgi:hypothetical protein
VYNSKYGINHYSLNNQFIELNLSEINPDADGVYGIHIDTSNNKFINYYISIGLEKRKIHKKNINQFTYRMPLLYSIMKHTPIKLILEFENKQTKLKSNEILFHINFIKYSDSYKEKLLNTKVKCLTYNNEIHITNGYGSFLKKKNI